MSLLFRSDALVVQDGIMQDLVDVPGGRPDWTHDNPTRAAADFVADHADFTLEPPVWAFNESPLQEGLTQWPGGWLKKRPPG
jgi:cephalosporin hydroxylase